MSDKAVGAARGVGTSVRSNRLGISSGSIWHCDVGSLMGWIWTLRRLGTLENGHYFVTASGKFRSAMHFSMASIHISYEQDQTIYNPPVLPQKNAVLITIRANGIMPCESQALTPSISSLYPPSRLLISHLTLHASLRCVDAAPHSAARGSRMCSECVD